ncbi:MAG: sulfite exporter TauE/SafE family protein [Clostridia bacterium]|nr:sulfite exporter TauE/SafE family protein [Clostridia bacterium]
MLKEILIGFFAGIISGLFGTGGGLVLVPAFVYLLKMEQKQARATSLFCVLPIVVICSFEYLKSNYINFNVALKCAVGGAIGGLLGAKVLKNIPDILLRIMFIIFLVYASINMIVS